MTDLKMADLGALEETVAAVKKGPPAVQLTVGMATSGPASFGSIPKPERFVKEP